MGALVVAVVAVVVGWSLTAASLVGSLVAATGHLLALGPLGLVGGQVAQATNRLGGMPPRPPLLQRGVSAVRLRPERALSIGDLPALPALHRLPDRPIPHTTTLDRRRSLAEVA
jgi:hypothetical protein